MSDRFDARKVPVDAVVAVVVTVLTVLSVGVAGVDAVDCDSVVKVEGVVALSKKKSQVTFQQSVKGHYTRIIFHRNPSISRQIMQIQELVHNTDMEIVVSE